MPITFKCTCGRLFRTADENAGRTATCPDCNTKLIVPAATAMSAAPSAAPAAPQAPRVVVPPPLPEEDPPAPDGDAYNVQSEEVVPVPRRTDYPPPGGRPRRDDPYNRNDDSGRRRPNYGRDDIRNRIVKRPPASSGGMTGAGALAGIAMMVGAVVWFFGAGLLFDLWFFYPPILFVIGLVAFIKGLASGKA